MVSGCELGPGCCFWGSDGVATEWRDVASQWKPWRGVRGCEISVGTLYLELFSAWEMFCGLSSSVARCRCQLSGLGSCFCLLKIDGEWEINGGSSSSFWEARG